MLFCCCKKVKHLKRIGYGKISVGHFLIALILAIILISYSFGKRALFLPFHKTGFGNA